MKNNKKMEHRSYLCCRVIKTHIIICGAKEFGNPNPFYIRPKAHAKEEETSEDEQRRSKLSGDVAEDNPVLGNPRSRKEKAAHHQGQSPRASQGKAQVQ